MNYFITLITLILITSCSTNDSQGIENTTWNKISEKLDFCTDPDDNEEEWSLECIDSETDCEEESWTFANGTLSVYSKHTTETEFFEDTDTYSYILTGNTLEMSSENTNATFEISGDKLTISADDDDGPACIRIFTFSK